MARSRLSTGATGMSSHPSERSEEDFFQVSSSVPPALASQVPETMEAQPEAQPEAARPYLRRRSTLADVVAKNFTQATRTNMKRHLQAAVSVAFDTHLDVDTTEDDVKFNLSDATKRLLGPLGQMRIFDKSKKAFETFRSHRLRYHTMHYTFWSNFALAFCLGFWIAMIGLPNYALTVRRFIYGDTERTRDLLIASTLSWDHYWCDFSESGLSALEIANVTDCGAHRTELQMADFESQSFLSEFLRQGTSSRKTCGYNAGHIYMKPYKRFWIGSAAGNYFPVIDGNPPVFIHEINATSVADPILVDGGARCLIMCESSPNCAVWSWRSYTDGNNYGGICHFFTSKAELDKRMMYDVPRWVGGTCQSNAKTDYFCPKNVYGRYYNHAAITEPPDLRHRNLFSATSSSAELWFGILPESWAATWPNVVQMVVFTVFGGTGTTLQLAWQGFVGTSCACLNAFVMSMLFPHGGKAELCTELQMAAGACKAGELIFSSPGYSPFFGWLDILGILFLFLFSNSQMNTIKFGMSWHFFFMMDFINPKTGRKDCPNDTLFYGTICGSEYWFEVFVTTTLGCFFSVLITFIPFPLLNQRKAYSEMSTVGRTVSDIWRESVVYICGSRQTPQRYRIEAKIDAIAEQEMTMRSNLEIAWWESALLCRYDPRRQELLVIQENLQDIFDVLPAVKWCVLNEDFGGEHRGFIGDLQPHLQALVVEATELLELCIRAPYAKGEERRGMNNYIQESAIFVHRLQNFLVEAYRKKHLRLNADLADETTLILSVSFMARKAADLSQVLQEEQAACTCWQRNNMKLLAQGCWQGFKNTWSPALLLARPHLLFAVRNFLGIAAVFFLSIVLQNYIFTNYSPVMPATLALLISRYQNSAFTNNLHRLLGVLLGQVIPLLILSGLSLMHCGHTRWLVSFFSIWTYITFFAYMYFTSSTWSLVGCLVAGFGVYPLLQPCINPSLSDDVLSNKYAELAQIAMALAVQMAADFLLTRHGPADLAVNELARLLQCIFVGCEEHISGLEAIYKSSLPELQHALKEAQLAMHRARSLCSEADPKQRIMLGLYTPFNIGLYRSALDIIQGCMTCLNLVIVCEKTWEVNQSVRDQDEEETPNRKSFEDLEAVPAYSDADLHSMLKIAMESLEKIQKSFTPERILETARHISYSLETILRHRIEVKLEDELVSTLHEIDLLDEHFNMEELDRWLSEVSERTSDIRTDKHELTNNLQARLVVGARAIAQLHFRLAELHSLCLKSSLV